MTDGGWSVLSFYFGLLFWCWRHSYSGYHLQIPLWGMFAYTNSRPLPVITHQGDVTTPLIIQACLRHPYIQAPREKWLCFAGFEPAIACLKWNMCPSYLHSIWRTDPDDIPPQHPSMAVFIVSPTHSRTKFSIARFPSIWKSPSGKICPARFAQHNSCLPASIHMVVDKYLESIWGQTLSERGVWSLN